MYRINTPADVANMGRVHIDTGDGVRIEVPVTPAPDLAARLAALEQDTDWRDVSADLRLGATGILHIRRVGLRVYWRLRDFTAGTAHAFYWPPTGLNTPSEPSTYPPQSPGNPSPIFLDGTGRFTRPITAAPLGTGRWWSGEYVLPAGTPPLTTYPGTPA